MGERRFGKGRGVEGIDSICFKRMAIGNRMLEFES